MYDTFQTDRLIDLWLAEDIGYCDLTAQVMVAEIGNSRCDTSRLVPPEYSSGFCSSRRKRCVGTFLSTVPAAAAGGSGDGTAPPGDLSRQRRIADKVVRPQWAAGCRRAHGRDAGTGRERHLAGVDGERAREQGLQLAAKTNGLTFIDFLEQQRKLLSAYPRNRVAGAEPALDPLRHVNKQLVTRVVPHAPVDDLEVGKAHKDHRER